MIGVCYSIVIMDNQVIFATVGAISGALITSLIAPYFLQAKTRRETRASALRKLMEVELSRWASSRDHELYRTSQIELRAAVLVANGSRPIADNYAKMAAVARSFSDANFEAENENPESGYIPTDIADAVNSAASLLSRSLWTPYLLRPLLLLQLRRIQSEQLKVKNKYVGTPRERHWDTRII